MVVIAYGTPLRSPAAAASHLDCLDSLVVLLPCPFFSLKTNVSFHHTYWSVFLAAQGAFALIYVDYERASQLCCPFWVAVVNFVKNEWFWRSADVPGLCPLSYILLVSPRHDHLPVQIRSFFY
jgi:hypothetical protein